MKNISYHQNDTDSPTIRTPSTPTHLSRENSPTKQLGGHHSHLFSTPPTHSLSSRQTSPTPVRRASPSPSQIRSISTQSVRSDVSITSRISNSSMGGAAASLELQLDNLRKKLRIMDTKRKEDHEKIVHLQSENKDALRLEKIVKRLQAKLSPMHEEIVGLREKLQSSEAERAKLIQDSTSQDEALELATLDREMAEEKMEHLIEELNELREQWGEMEMEYEALKEENALYEELRENGELGNGSAEVLSTTDAAIDNVRLVKKNEKLEIALLKLRDVMKEQQLKYEEDINNLRNDASSSKITSESYAHIEDQLREAEDIIHDLRIQLDDALGSEDLIENLAEKNLELTEKCEELQHTIDELETLKALNDELESNHILTEKQLMIEFDELEALHVANGYKLVEAQERNAYLESAIVKFRDVVTTLESDLTELRTSNQLINADSAAMAVHTKSLMELNMKLSNTALEANSKTMDLQLRKFEAGQAISQLSIVKCYLSEGYDADEMSIEALLRLERIAFTSQVVEDFLSTRSEAVTNNLIPVIQYTKIFLALMDVRRYSSALAYYMRYSTPEKFQKLSILYGQTEAVEALLTSVIEILRNDNLQEQTFLHDLENVLPPLQGLYHEVSKEFNKEPSYTLLLNDLSQLQQNSSFIRDLFNELKSSLDEIHITESKNPVLMELSNQIASFSRVKIFASKLIKEVTAGYDNGMIISSNHISKFSEIFFKSRSLVQFLINVLHDVRISMTEPDTPPITEIEVVDMIRNQFITVFSLKLAGGDNISDNDLSPLIAHEFQNISNTLKSFSSIEDFQEPFEEPQSPWVVNATKIKEMQILHAEKDTEITELKAQLQKLATTLRSRDKSIEELDVKVGLLNSKMAKSKDQAEVITELNKALSNSLSQENKLKDTISKLRKSLLDQEKYLTDKWRKSKGTNENEKEQHRNEAAMYDQLSSMALRSEIKGLRDTISHLSRARISQHGNLGTLNSQQLDNDYSWLDFDRKNVIRVISDPKDRKYRQNFRSTLLDTRKSLLEFEPISLKRPQKSSFDPEKNSQHKEQSMWLSRKSDPRYALSIQKDIYFKVQMIIQKLVTLEK